MKAKILAFLNTVWSDLVDTYKRCKIFIIMILLAVAYFEWARIKAAFLVFAAQKEQKADSKEDAVLSTQENANNSQADMLVQQAQSLPEQQPQIQSNWYEKSKK